MTKLKPSHGRTKHGPILTHVPVPIEVESVAMSHVIVAQKGRCRLQRVVSVAMRMTIVLTQWTLVHIQMPLKVSQN